MEKRTIQLVLLVVLLVLLMLVVIVFVLFSVFMKRKNTLINERADAEKRFEHEIAETQIEIREETLRNISWELHDNIGQLLTLAKIKAQNMHSANQEEINEIADTIGTGLNELRALSKSINPEALNNLTLEQALRLEVARFKRMHFLDATMRVEGEPIKINAKAEIVIFRIMQEFFTNTMKHSRADNLKIKLYFSPNELKIVAQDDGVGFTESESTLNGIGLLNMKRRAQLINAEVAIHSYPGDGTRLNLNYKI
tara:strand:- start:3063 stop:3824 length:762 start_codon:yes stop_codon:yes gene_type:complete